MVYLEFSELSGVASIDKTVLITLQKDFQACLVLDDGISGSVVLVSTRLFSSTSATDTLVSEKYSSHAGVAILSLKRHYLGRIGRLVSVWESLDMGSGEVAGEVLGSLI